MKSNGVDNSMDKLSDFCSNQIGQIITMQVKKHSDKICHEYILKPPSFSFKRWFIWTSLLNALGYGMNMHMQDSYIMSGMIVILIFALALKLHLKVVKESLLVVENVGVQVTTQYASGRILSVFYDIAHIKDIIINEAISMNKVVTYMAIYQNKDRLKEKQMLIPLFTSSLPRLECLMKIRNSVVTMLTKGKSK